MADRNTTGAVHLTTIDLDISGVRQRCQEIDTLIRETAENARNAWENNNPFGGEGGGGDGGAGGGRRRGGTFESAISNIESLELQYRQLINTIQSSRLDNETISALSADARAALADVRALFDVVSESGRSTDQTTQWYRELSSILKSIKGEFADVTSAAKEARRGLADAESAPAFIDTEKQIETLNNSYSNLIKTVSDARIVPNEEFRGFANNLADANRRMQEIVNTTREGTPLTAEQSRTYQELQVILIQLKTAWAQLNKEIEPQNTNASAQSVSNLNLQYKNFLKTLSSSKLSDTALGNIPNAAQEAARRMAELTEQTKDSTHITDEQQREFEELRRTLTGLKGELSDATAEANRTGQGFKVVGAAANDSSGAVTRFINALGDKLKWMAAYQLIMLVRQAFSGVIGTIKDTEDSVVALQRVLSSEKLADSTVSSRLYEIAYQYGQTFETVSDTFLKFAQTGLGFENSAKATEAAMLGINTAELEVATATNGLIAVMSQFGYEASDLELIIDKINTTADHFPVTSEKIVAALQRAGGTAKSFGMTLEETIGIITALSQATGRGGEQIGTALNSLITFSNKAGSLEKFSEFLEVDASQYGVLELWRELSEKIKDGDESLAKMMSTSEEFNDLYDEELATSIGLTEEFNKAQMEAKDVYSTVGTYRQNYFIALLNNIDTAIKAMDNMGNASGYSMQQNEEAVQRLTAQWNQLVISAKELAIQFGDAGFLDFLKWLTDAGSGIMKFTKSIGGLKTLLIAFLGVLVTIKSAKLASMFSGWIEGISNFSKNVKLAITDWAAYKAKVDQATVSQEEFNLVSKGSVSAIGILITAISAVVAIYQRWKQEQEQAREAAIELGYSTEETAKELASLKKEFEDQQKIYEQTGEKTDALTSSADALVSKLQEEGIIVENVADAYDYLANNMDAVNEKTRDQLSEDLGKYRDAAAAASTVFAIEFQNAFRTFTQNIGDNAIELPLNVITQDGQDIYDFLSGKGFDVRTIEWNQDVKNLVIPIDTSDVEKTRDSLERLKDVIHALSGEGGYTQAYLSGQEWYNSLLSQINALESSAKAYDDAIERVEFYTNEVDELTESTEASTESQERNTDSVIELEEELESLADKYKDVKDKVNEFSSSYDSLVDAVDDYNESGYLTAENLEKLLELEPEYISLLEIKNGELSISKDGVDSLAASTDAYMQSMVALKIAEEAETLAKELQTAATEGLTLEQYKASAASAVLNSELYNAVLGMINGTGTANSLASALSNVANAAGLAGDYMQYFNSQFQNIFSGYSQLLSIPRTYIPKPSGSGSGGRSGSGSGGGNNKAEKDALQAEIKAWKKREDETKDYYKNLKDETEDYYDGLIDNLKAVQEENDRINAQLDYYSDRQKTITNLEQARSRSGIEWREKEMEYQQSLIELDEDWRRKQEDWNIEDQIDELKRLKEISVSQIEDAMDAAVKEIEDVIEKLQEKVNKLSSSTGSSVGGGIASGVSAGAEEAENTFSTMLKNVDSMFTETFEFQTGKSKAQIEELKEEMKSYMSDITNRYKDEFPTALEEGALKAYQRVRKNLVDPLNADISKLNQMARELSSLKPSFIASAWNDYSRGVSFPGYTPNNQSTSYNTSNKTINMYANIGNNNVANSSINYGASLLGIRSNNF